MYLSCQFSGILILPLIILWLQSFHSSFFPIHHLSHPIETTRSMTQTYLSKVLHSNPSSALPPPHVLPTQYVAKPHAPINASVHLGCWKNYPSPTWAAGKKKKITKPYRLRPPKTHGLYHQLPGNLSVSPGSSYFLTTLSLFTDVLKVCAPSLLGYILFTLKIWSSLLDHNGKWGHQAITP